MSRKKIEVSRIWVDRLKLKQALPRLTESQSSLLSANTVKSLPDDYELFPAEGVKEALESAGVEWRDTKTKPKVPMGSQAPAA